MCFKIAFVVNLALDEKVCFVRYFKFNGAEVLLNPKLLHIIAVASDHSVLWWYQRSVVINDFCRIANKYREIEC